MSDTKNNLAALAADVEVALARRRSRSAAAISWIREAALLPVLAVLLVVGAILNSHFLTLSNMTGIGQQISALGVVVVGESLILLTGGLDLSLESTYGLAPMLAAWLIVPVAAAGNGWLLNPYLGLRILLAVGAAVGVFNGLLIVKGRLNGFIVTLGMTVLLGGIQDGIVKGQAPYNLPTAFGYLGAADIGAVPVSLIVAAVIFILTGLFLRYHRLGRAIYAVGGNREAARAAGIKVDRVRIGVYVAGSILAAIGGLMEAGRVSSVTPTQGYGGGHHLPGLRRRRDRRGVPAGRPREHGRRRVRRHPARRGAEHPDPGERAELLGRRHRRRRHLVRADPGPRHRRRSERRMRLCCLGGTIPPMPPLILGGNPSPQTPSAPPRIGKDRR